MSETSTAPLLSICLPTRGRGRELSEFLESLLGQDLSDVELVISNNASRDHTAEIIADYKRRGLPIVDRHFDEGVPYGRNLLETVRHARGQFIWFMGDDDLMSPGAVARIKAVLLANDPDAMLINYSVWNHDFSRQLSPDAFGTEQSAGFVDFPGHPLFNLGLLTFLGCLLVRNAPTVREVLEENTGNSYAQTLAIFQYSHDKRWYACTEHGVRQRFPLGNSWNQADLFFVDFPEIFRRAESLHFTPAVLSRWKKKFLKEILTRRCLSDKINRGHNSRLIIDGLVRYYGQFAYTWLVSFPLYLLPHWLLVHLKQLFSYNR